MTRGRPSPWSTWLAKRRKAVAALAAPLGLGLAGLAPDEMWARATVVVIGALVTAGIVHQVPNRQDGPAA